MTSDLDKYLILKFFLGVLKRFYCWDIHKGDFHPVMQSLKTSKAMAIPKTAWINKPLSNERDLIIH